MSFIVSLLLSILNIHRGALRRVLDTRTLTVLCVALSVLGTEAMAESTRGLILESYVGKRPRDADHIVAPLLDELKQAGFGGSSVAGTRIHSQHSITAEQLTNKQIDDASLAVKESYAAYIDLHLGGAIDSGTRGLDILMSRPATMARQQMVRELLYEVLISMSMAYNRLGDNAGLEKMMGEFIRSFPDKEVSRKRYGPEAIKLYQKINRKMLASPKGELQIVSDEGSMVFVNEHYIGIGSVKLNLFPGRYRVFTQAGAQVGRVHLVTVEAKRQQTLVINKMVDKCLRTNSSFVGLVFDTEKERAKYEKQVALNFGRAIHAKTIVIVGVRKDAVVAVSIDMETGKQGPLGRLPLPASAAKLRDLATFVKNGQASPGIEVIPAARVAADGGNLSKGALHLEGTTDESESPVWSYATWGLGAVGLGAGAYLLSIDGDGTCELKMGQKACPETHDTFNAGIGSVVVGTGLGVLGWYFWTKESPSTGKMTGLSFVPSTTGIQASWSMEF